MISQMKTIKCSDVEFFLAYPWFNHALDRYINKDISLEDFFNHITCIIGLWFSVRYVFNALTIDIDKEKDNIDFLLNKLLLLGINKLTICDIKLIDYISNNFKNFSIWLSTVNRIDSIEKFKISFWFYNFDKVILSNSINYDLLQLTSLINFFKEKNIDVELIANELTRCDGKCDVCFSYADFGKNISHKKVFYCCWEKQSIISFLDSNLIRPEDVFLYERIWVTYLKLWLRKTETIRSIKIINSYIHRKHIGSFFELVWDSYHESYPYLDNSRLDNVILSKILSRANHMK